MTTGRAATFFYPPPASTRRRTALRLRRATPQPKRPTEARASGRAQGLWLPVLCTNALLALVAMLLPPRISEWLVAVSAVIVLWTVGEAVGAAAEQGGLRSMVRQPVALISAGALFTAAGETMHALGAGYPSMADVIELGGYPFFIAGLLRLTRSRIRERAVDTVLIAAIVPVTLGAFAWAPFVSAVDGWLPHTHHQPWLAVAFLAVDGLSIAMIGRLAVLFRGKPVAYQLLLASFACPLGAHLARSLATVTAVVPSPFGVQSLLIVGFGLLGAAALHPSFKPPAGAPRVKPAPIGWTHLLLMAAAVLVGPLAVLLRYRHAGNWVLLAVGAPALISLLVVAHLGRMVRERSRLEYESTHDALTGLDNRQSFHDRLTLRLSRENTTGAPFAVGFLDLDRFKKVNDSLGHDAGDALLCAVADRLIDAVRTEDTVARLAGDEFGLILSSPVDEAALTAVAHRLIGQFAAPFAIAGHEVFTSPSIGFALFPDHGRDVQTLLKRADEAMYQAKSAGRNTFEVFSDRVGSRAHQQLAVETGLHAAIAKDQLVLHYQPKLDLRTGALTGVEALVRWDHPTLGIIGPNAFIRLAEESGLVAPLGEWVLRTACRQASEWYRCGRPMTVSVNLSARQFQLQDVTGTVRHALAVSGLPAPLLELELTESISFECHEAVTATLAELRAMGVRCSIDDFGTGHSGIGYLNDYPIDKIKLDKSFVSAITADNPDGPLVRAIIAMAHSLGLEVIAEGVETEQQLEFLRLNECDVIQGYLLSRPLTAADLNALVEDDADPTTMAALRYTDGVQTEQELGEALWQQSLVRLAAQPRAADVAVDASVAGQVKRTFVLTAAAGVMSLPMAAGVSAAGALPPQLQSAVSAALNGLRVYAPDPAMGIAAPGDAPVPEQLADGPVPAAGSATGIDPGVGRPLGHGHLPAPAPSAGGDGRHPGHGPAGSGPRESPPSNPAPVTPVTTVAAPRPPVSAPPSTAPPVVVPTQPAGGGGGTGSGHRSGGGSRGSGGGTGKGGGKGPGSPGSGGHSGGQSSGGKSGTGGTGGNGGKGGNGHGAAGASGPGAPTATPAPTPAPTPPPTPGAKSP